MIRTATIGSAAQWLCRNRDRHFHRIISQVPALEANCRNSTRLFHPIYGVDFLHLLCYLLLLPLTCAFVLCLLTLSLEVRLLLPWVAVWSLHIMTHSPTAALVVPQQLPRVQFRSHSFNPTFNIVTS
ncbi:hypothetical protein BDW71DRAFT_186747 [Aspergillus fruticulosus]